ncbi:MAG: hypothetical protein K8R23_08470 [Chthoniobacter sp.]|nr:hypothetical protein [Chthoniobacter sp.]
MTGDLRILQPELLDSLPPDHPDALHNRRDLRLTNFAMGNFRWFARVLPPLARPGERVLELGAGTGELGFRLHRRGLAVDGLDRWTRPASWAAAHAWHRADVELFPAYADYPVVIGNLIFHQFSDDTLAALGAKLRPTARVIVACEPVRRRLSQILFATVAPLLGANDISRHDARVSIAAGFRGDELPLVLGLDVATWNCRVTTTFRGAYRLIAVRRS